MVVICFKEDGVVGHHECLPSYAIHYYAHKAVTSIITHYGHSVRPPNTRPWHGRRNKQVSKGLRPSRDVRLGEEEA